MINKYFYCYQTTKYNNYREIYLPIQCVTITPNTILIITLSNIDYYFFQLF